MCHKRQPIPRRVSLSRKLNSKLAVKWIESSSHFLDLRSDQFCHNSVILTESPPYRDCSERNCSLVNHKNRWLSSLRPHTWSDRPRNCFKCYKISHIVLRKKCRWHLFLEINNWRNSSAIAMTIPRILLPAIGAQITSPNDASYEMRGSELWHKIFTS